MDQPPIKKRKKIGTAITVQSRSEFVGDPSNFQETSTGLPAQSRGVKTRVLATEIRGSMLLNTLEALGGGVGADTRPECELAY